MSKGRDQRTGEQRRTRGRGSRLRPAKKRVSLVYLSVIGAVVALGLVVGALTSGTAATHHPEPRLDLTGESVVSAARYAGYARIADTYRKAREIAVVLDGIYCYCECSRHSGHRSLLSCFESDHGAGCDICMSEAEIAYQMHLEGRSLDEIRAQIDEFYGT